MRATVSEMSFVAWGFAAACCGCRGDAGIGPLAVLVSGDTAGWIVPCGCASNQFGGLPRRSAYCAQLAEQGDVILADVGGAALGTSAYDRMRFEAILAGEALMGYSAHNIGASEAALGIESLWRARTRGLARFVSANARSADGQLAFEPIVIVRKGGRRVALVGVLDPKYATREIRVDPPAEAVLRVLREHAGEYDAAVVLAYMPQDGLRRLAAAIPEVDVVAGGPTGQSMPPEYVGPVVVASATNKGKFLARLDAPSPGARSRWQAAIVAMDETLGDDPAQLDNLHRYYEELARQDFRADQTGWSSPALADVPDSPRIAGTTACFPCHEEDDKLWRQSKHARAWQSLVEKGAHVDPECQRCHSTGYGLAAGFVSARRSRERLHVGCESCHGPSRAHAKDPKVRTALSGRAKDACLSCHDRENSPKFQYEEYWTEIDHGHAVASTPASASDTKREDRP